jgi:hypothetical protein
MDASSAVSALQKQKQSVLELASHGSSDSTARRGLRESHLGDSVRNAVLVYRPGTADALWYGATDPETLTAMVILQTPYTTRERTGLALDRWRYDS